ncbi:MAG: NIPSNAP family containing protein [Pseudomonadota bacterium]|nr:NIPSNAP family containing protein [Pseudomonadota bacterium]
MNLGSTCLTALLAAQLGAAVPAQAEECCAVVELRQYITYPGKRDDLATLFEREFIESQEEVGIRVLGQFRDFNDPHRFTWLRGFSAMPARKQALTEFYTGPLWKRWKSAANATLYDNDDVLLLKPASAGSGFALDAVKRPGKNVTAPQAGLIVATLYFFKQPVSAEFISGFNADLAPIFQRSGARIIGRFVSEKSVNTFAQLPVREDVNVFVWLARFADRADYDSYSARLAQDTRWRDHLFAALYNSLAEAPRTLMLEPTARSLIR